MRILLIFIEKSLDLYLVSLDVALLVRAISMSFLNSLREEVSESMVSSSGIQFFTRLDLGDQCGTVVLVVSMLNVVTN